MPKITPMPAAQALQIAILLLEFEAETAQEKGNGEWRYECRQAVEALQQIIAIITLSKRRQHNES